jgi:hypothetical protein
LAAEAFFPVKLPYFAVNTSCPDSQQYRHYTALMAICLRAFASFMLCRSPNFDAVGAFVSVVNVNFETFSDQFHRLSIFQNHRIAALFDLLRLSPFLHECGFGSVSQKKKETTNRTANFFSNSHGAALGDSSIKSQRRMRLIHDKMNEPQPNAGEQTLIRLLCLMLV